MYNNVNVNHPLIHRDNNYVSIKKYVSIHSIDRDITKWTEPNEFEIELPQSLKQVQYIKLSDITIPSDLFNISSKYQNNKLLMCKFTGTASDTYLKTNLSIHSTNGCGIGAIVSSITIANNLVTSIDVDGGTGYLVGDKIFISVNNIELGSYIIQNGDITNGVFNSGVLTGTMPSNENKIVDGTYNATDKMTPTIITIPDGTYTPENLASTLETLMNIAFVTNYNSDASVLREIYVVYNNPEKKIYIGISTNNTIALFFDEKSHEYILANSGYGTCQQNNDQYYTKNIWGLGAILGFNKTNYFSKAITVDGMFNTPINNYADISASINISTTHYTDTNAKKHSNIWLPLGTTNSGHFIVAPNIINIFTHNTLYMEIDKYNNSDELVPNVSNTSSYNITNHQTNQILSKETCKQDATNSTLTFKRGLDSSSRTSNIKMRSAFNNPSENSNYGGKVNSYFAKLIRPNIINQNNISLTSDDIKTITIFSNQLEERIQKIKVKFRFHDGTMVDFGNADIHFTLEFGTILSDQEKNMKIRNIN